MMSMVNLRFVPTGSQKSLNLYHVNMFWFTVRKVPMSAPLQMQIPIPVYKENQVAECWVAKQTIKETW